MKRVYAKANKSYYMYGKGMGGTAPIHNGTDTANPTLPPTRTVHMHGTSATYILPPGTNTREKKT